MQELLHAIRDFYSKSNNEAEDNQERITLRSQVKQLVDRTFAQNPNARSIRIEINQRYMPYIEAIFEDPLLNQNYLVYQDPLEADQVIIEIKELEL